MRKILLLMAACGLAYVSSCSDDEKDFSAANAAKQYYDSLVAGNAAYFVRGTYLPDTIPPSYRSQLEDNAQMFMARMDKEHHGIHEVRVLDCVTDTIKRDGVKSGVRTANAFLVLCFGDSLNEEIAVQMVEHKGQWLMR